MTLRKVRRGYKSEVGRSRMPKEAPKRLQDALKTPTRRLKECKDVLKTPTRCP